MTEKKKVNLAMSGSSTKLPLHVGALKAVLEHCDVEEIWGNSGGSLIGGLHAAGMSVDKMESLIMETDFAKVAGMHWWSIPLFVLRGLITLDRSWYMSSGKRFEKFLKDHLGEMTFKDARCKIGMVASDIDKEEEFLFSSEKTPDAPLWIGVRASTCLPFAFKPVNYLGRRLEDGGYFRDFPIGLTSNRERRSVGVLVSGSKREDNTGIRGKFSQVLRLLLKGNISSSIRAASEGESEVILETSYDLPTYQFSVSHDQKEEMIRQGYECMLGALKEWT